MHFIVYKITNTLNQKYYIGKHQTTDLNDGYMGSGKLLKRAIIKYGIQSFIKEILFDFDNEAEMNDKEKELVVISEDTYNLCPGGKGGWGYINSSSEILEHRDSPESKRKGYMAARLWEHAKRPCSQETKDKLSKKLKNRKTGNSWLGRTHTEDSKRKIGEANKNLIGERNGAFGKMWITNGTENRMVKKGLDSIPEGWYNGRKNVHK